LNQSVVRYELNGTLIYKSPEMIKFLYDDKTSVELKTDVWSLGIVIYELITLKRPFENRNEILNANIPEFKTNIPDLFKDLIRE
jgi:serine/threonine protein kinase